MREPIKLDLARGITGLISEWRLTDEALLNRREDFQDLQERAVGGSEFQLAPRRLEVAGY